MLLSILIDTYETAVEMGDRNYQYLEKTRREGWGEGGLTYFQLICQGFDKVQPLFTSHHCVNNQNIHLSHLSTS